jgi:hypothetical protein
LAQQAQQARKAFKVISDQPVLKAFKVFKAFKVKLDPLVLQAFKVI